MTSSFRYITLAIMAFMTWYSASGQEECFSRRVNARNIDLLTENIDVFGLDLFKNVARGTPKSVFMSPYGVWSALLLAYFGAGGNTLRDLGTALGTGGDKSVPFSATKAISRAFEQTNLNGGPIIQSVNRAFLASDIPVDQCFRGVTDVDQLDFSNGPTAVKVINDLVAAVTKGKINEVLSSGDVQNVRLVLLNVIYFKGQWEVAFEKNYTRFIEFVNEDGNTPITPGITTPVPLMVHRKGTLKHAYSSTLKADVVELPFKGGEVSLYAFLSRPGESTSNSVLDQLNKASLNDVVSRLTSKVVNFAFPKFKFTTEYGDDLKQILTEMGVGELFSARANLTAFSENREPLIADSINHKADIELDEEGATAAAATTIIITRSGSGNQNGALRLVFNRPFSYIIRHKPTGITLMAGRYAHPQDAKNN